MCILLTVERSKRHKQAQMSRRSIKYCVVKVPGTWNDVVDDFENVMAQDVNRLVIIDCNLAVLPSWVVTQLRSLKQLRLSDNMLHTLPDELAISHS
jgi:hypothetical protein